MGMLTEYLQKEKIDPVPYLRKIYTLSLIANPYNFLPISNLILKAEFYNIENQEPEFVSKENKKIS